MNSLNWIYTYGFFEARLFDLPNFAICLVLILILGRKLKVASGVQFVLILHCFLPFILNDVLFATNYMPDQFKYWKTVNLIRNGDFVTASYSNADNVVTASYFLAALPFPNAIGPWSLGFYNSFLYVLLFFWLYSKKVFTPVSQNFYLFFPSFALYSALSLRETLIMFFMVVAIQLARDNRKVLMLLALVPLYFIKSQNFIILAPLIIIYSIFKISQKGMTLIRAGIISLLGMLAVLASAPIALPVINKARVNMFVEDGGRIEDIELISGIGDFILKGLTSGFEFLLKPFVWEASGFLQLVQTFENLIILAILFLITRQAWKTQPNKLAFWLLFMALAMSVYGLVVFNYGTAVRYRYAFVVIYVLFVCADCNIQKLMPKKERSFSR